VTGFTDGAGAYNYNTPPAVFYKNYAQVENTLLNFSDILVVAPEYLITALKRPLWIKL